MTTRRLAGPIIATAMASACLTPAPVPLRPVMTPPPERVRIRIDGRVVAVPTEQYVLGSVLSEVSPIRETAKVAARIFEVQAVLARTYAVAHLGRHASEGFDLCDTTHCQLYEPSRLTSSRFAVAAREAVARTAGRMLVFSGRPIESLFHADCGGVTAAADSVWGGRPVPYLLMSPDNVPSLEHRAWQATVDVADARAALNRDARSDVGGRLDGIAVVVRDSSGRAAHVRLEGERTRVVRGEDLRAILNRSLGAAGIQSTLLRVSRMAGAFRFNGAGFGHGVGLCQAGAAARARRGDPVEAILAAYFPGASLVTSRGM